MTKYIHYGNNQYHSDRFRSIKNRPGFTKPWGGLWASPINAKYGWKEWNDDENFRECNKENSFIFTLTEKANVIHIRSVNDLKLLPKQKMSNINIFDTGMIYPDYECLLNYGCDAVELHLSEEDTSENDFMEGLYWSLYGWDCDSIIILNPDVIIPYKEIKLTNCKNCGAILTSYKCDYCGTEYLKEVS